MRVAVIDVTSTAAQDADAAREFFATSTGHLFAAEQRAGVEHHVVRPADPTEL